MTQLKPEGAIANDLKVSLVRFLAESESSWTLVSRSELLTVSWCMF